MFFNGQNSKLTHLKSFSLILYLLLINSSRYFLFLSVTSHCIKEILYAIAYSKGNGYKIKTKRHIFSTVSDVDIEKYMFFLINNFRFVLVF